MQFGTADGVRVTDPTPWQVELLMALEHGTTRSELRHLSDRLHVTAPAEEFLDYIAPAIVVSPPPFRVSVVSQGSSVEDADTDDAVRAVISLPAVTLVDRHPDMVWLIARDVIIPRSCRELMSTDTPHLPITIMRSAVIVGPVIVPGVNACASCLALHEADRDAAWPILASQLVARWAQPLSVAEWGEIAITAARLMAQPAGAESMSYELTATHPPRARRYQPHAGCGCQSPAGNATVIDAACPRPEPTTTRASSLHA